MEWTKEEIIRLLELYKKKKIMWDTKHVNYYKKNAKQKAWLDIAMELGFSEDACRKKMEYLLASLRREKMKIRRSIRSGKGKDEIYTSSWFAFDHMKFLLDRKKSDPELSTFQTATSDKFQTATREEAEQSTQEPVEHEYPNTIWMPSKGGNPETTHPKSPTPKTKKPKTSGEFAASTTHVNDENKHFGNLVASKLHKYDDRVRSLIQIDILNIFVRASSGFYGSEPNPFPDNIDQNHDAVSQSSDSLDIKIEELL